jgi:hypothetical protein
MGARRSKGQRKGRASKMHDTNRDGLERHSDNVGSKVARERPPAIPGLAESTRKFLAVARRAL